MNHVFAFLTRGWALTKTSFRVLKLDKEILLLPVLSGIAMLGVIVAGMVFAGSALAAGVLETDAGSLLALLGLFAFYVLGYFVVLFFNAAVIECAMIRFNGGDPVVKDGLRKAWSKKGRIFQWSIVAAAVSVVFAVLRQLARNQQNPMGRIIASIAVWIAEAAWWVVSFFVMPILIYRDVGPIQALKESWGTVKKSGGEQFVGSFAISGLFMIGYLVTGGLAFALVYLMPALWLVVVPVAVLAIGALAVMQSALQGILIAAAYKYVQDGRMPEALNGEVRVEKAPIPYA